MEYEEFIESEDEIEGARVLLEIGRKLTNEKLEDGAKLKVRLTNNEQVKLEIIVTSRKDT